MNTISITNQKGGVAKTTTAQMLGYGLHRKGYRVLLVDLDPQTNLSFTAQVDLLNLEYTLYDVFKNGINVNKALIELEQGLDILVGGIELSSADRDFTRLGRERMLFNALNQLDKTYDYCIIDCPPSLGVLNENSLTASNDVIVPVKADIYSLQGIGQLKAFIDDIKDNSNPGLSVCGVLITCVDTRTSLYKDLQPHFEQIAEQLGTNIFNTFTRATVSVQNVQAQRGNLYNEAPSSNATKDYSALIDEILNRGI